MMADEKELTQGFSLGNKSCAVIGLGGLGTNVAIHLAGAGMKRIYLCDFDTVGKTNLNRQFMYTYDDIGFNKTDILKKRLSEYAPDSEIVAVKEKINDISDLQFSAECDIIFSCVDNNDTRIILEEFCRNNNVPLVHGGIDGFYGVSYLYVPSYSPSPSAAGFCEGKNAKHNISAVAGIIGSFQATLGIRYLITNDYTLSGRLLVFDECKTDTLNINF